MFGFDISKHKPSTNFAILLVIIGLMVFVWKGKADFSQVALFGSAVLGFLYQGGNKGKGDGTVETDITKL
jgi:hypothetical protein